MNTPHLLKLDNLQSSDKFICTPVILIPMTVVSNDSRFIKDFIVNYSGLPVRAINMHVSLLHCIRLVSGICVSFTPLSGPIQLNCSRWCWADSSVDDWKMQVETSYLSHMVAWRCVSTKTTCMYPYMKSLAERLNYMTMMFFNYASIIFTGVLT